MTQAATMPLALLSVGESATVKRARGDSAKLRQRLADLGLTEGAEVRMLKNDPSGPLIIAIADSRLALDRSLAHKVMVTLNAHTGTP